MPFLLLPFRPGLDTIGAKNFIRQYFKSRYEGHTDSKAMSQRELRLMEPIVSFHDKGMDLSFLTALLGPLQYNEMVLEPTASWCRLLGNLRAV
jgi:hypothetical protein